MTIIAPHGAETPFGVTPRMKAYPVAAIFQIGMSTFDNTFIFMPLAEAQTFFNQEGQANVIEVYVANPDDMDAMRAKIEPAQQRPMIDTDWRQLNRSFFDVLAVESNVMFAILALIMLVAALNIISGLIMLVQDKARAIAVLRTMGATRGAVMRIFLITGATIGVVGTFVGLILGLVVAYNVEPIRRFLMWMTGAEPVSVRILFPVAVALAGGTDGRRRRRRRWRWSSRSPRRSIRRGAPRSSIRWRRCAMNDAGRFSALSLEDVERRYGRGETTVEVLNGASLALLPGQSVALIAPSGAGKSTLLHLAGLLERPSAGEITVGGAPTSTHERRPAHLAEARPDRLRLPVPPAPAGVLGAGKPRAAADDRGAHAGGGRERGPASSSPISASPSARATGRRSSRAASSSASRSRAPSPTARESCSPTSRPAISTRRPPTTCSTRWRNW